MTCNKHEDPLHQKILKALNYHTTFLLYGQACKKNLLQDVLYPLCEAFYPTFPHLTTHLKQKTFHNILIISPPQGSDNISIDHLKNALYSLYQKAAMDGPRFVWLDHLDQCNRFGWNALLKVLEEPPVHTFFFLRAHHLGRVLPTIRSRSMLIKIPENNNGAEAKEDGNLAVLEALKVFLKTAYKNHYSQLQSLVLPLLQKKMASHDMDKLILSILKSDTSPRGVETYLAVHRFILKSHNTHLDEKMRLLSIASFIGR
jgi:hypothetical protein